MRSQLADSYRHCRDLTRRHGTTYYWSTYGLPAPKRPPVWSIYAFCRLADDIVDETTTASVATRTQALTDLGDRLFDDLDAGRSDHPVLAAVIDTMRRFGHDPECFRRFLAAMAMDLSVTRYQTYRDLLRYMDGSAAVIGEMMLPILEPTSVEAVTPAAISVWRSNSPTSSATSLKTSIAVACTSHAQTSNSLEPTPNDASSTTHGVH